MGSPMTDEALRRQIAALAKDSSLVIVTDHAAERMALRNVSLTQVLEVLRKGTIYEPAHLNIYGNWQCTLERVTTGDLVRVACAVDDSDPSRTVAVAITVIRARKRT
jgi:replicative DNA helicase